MPRATALPRPITRSLSVAPTGASSMKEAVRLFREGAKARVLDWDVGGLQITIKEFAPGTVVSVEWRGEYRKVKVPGKQQRCRHCGEVL